ncbi:hypothetical protein Nisw_06670 [Candidatus Nitrosopumilus sp. SW]|uniref:hypothetical protein n=1 Tax=Candidatus Nitrosopumilus sp. SW TaxID=2508726 RepID=UPI001152D7D1|nr:hypothetical protein [Candidatus Nitrosopumilus sp. SW]QDI89228.1 hypothetical protein Nisw_06670 [Candidatus Nitrosopumilus sp. SW]
MSVLTSKSILYIVIGVLFLIAVLILTFSKPFGENWIIGIGFLGGAIGVLILGIYVGLKKVV